MLSFDRTAKLREGTGAEDVTVERLSVVVIDDDQAMLDFLQLALSECNCDVFVADSGPRGYEIVRDNTIDLVLTDYVMPQWDGYRVLKEVRELNPEIDVVVMTAHGKISQAVEVMKTGAYDYLLKPINVDDLKALLERIQEKRLLRRENQLLKQQLQQRFKFSAIVSQSKEMEEVLSTAVRAAPSKAPILIQGESGTGKELIARAIHFASPRRAKPFVAVNMAALPESLVESELFGHERGAFTGALQRQIGRFEQAHPGTLFIDEVGEVPLPTQVKLLRAIQFGQIERLGASEQVEVDVRIISATHRNLEEMVRSNSFRNDLYYRLNVILISIPPLRRRKTDIPPLIEHFIEKHAAENRKPVTGTTREALDRLMKYDFPGNVRELENIIERAVVLCRGELISQQDLPQQVKLLSAESVLDPYSLGDGYEKKMMSFETAMIQEALERSGGNKSAAARLLGITERRLRSRLERLKLQQS